MPSLCSNADYEEARSRLDVHSPVRSSLISDEVHGSDCLLKMVVADDGVGSISAGQLCSPPSHGRETEIPGCCFSNGDEERDHARPDRAASLATCSVVP